MAKLNVPKSFISWADFANAASAARFKAEPTLTRFTPASSNCLSVKAGPARTFTGRVTAEQTSRDRFQAWQARRIQHIGPGFFEGLQALDGVIEIRPPMEKIFGPRRQHEGNVLGDRTASTAAAMRSTARLKS